ncbi:MAG: nicotinamide-nucleotide amidase [Porticoccaceae bacterium]|nr:nicotinamide-nucleotide amidase [Porticoccaceae bacterium]
MYNEIYHLSEQLGRALEQKNATVTSAESCTGGGVAQAITAVAGSSGWFNRSFVTYANSAKQEMLGVEVALLEEHGAVSEPVVLAMVKGAARLASADYAVAISGIAGPGGGSADKPVGTVWFAWLSPDRVIARKYHLSGDRNLVREQAVKISLQELLHQVTGCNTV